MIIQNSSAFKVPIITSTTAPTTGEEVSGAFLGYMWYETDTAKLKAFVDDNNGTPLIKELN